MPILGSSFIDSNTNLIRDHKMKPILIAVAALYAAVIASTVGLAEGSAEQFYKSRFFLSGLLARGAGVCGGDCQNRGVTRDFECLPQDCRAMGA